MFLYDLPLQSASSIDKVIAGHFSGQNKVQEILALHGATAEGGSILELFRPESAVQSALGQASSSQKYVSVLKMPMFGVVRSILPFRLIGSAKDYVILGSDSGKIVILEYNTGTNRFDKVHAEAFGKSGCRRLVPGQYLAVDPKGRAVMIAAIEKQKFAYLLNRDSQARLTISSPLEAHKSRTFLYYTVGLDVGFENPIFACIESDYAEYEESLEEANFTMTKNNEAIVRNPAVEKVLTYYELDLGLNHVVRRWSDPVDSSTNLLIALPGGADGPGGVIACSEGFVCWKHEGFEPVKVPLPRRRDAFGELHKAPLVIASSIHKTKNLFILLVQTEQGDIFRVHIDTSSNILNASGQAFNEGGVKALSLSYFDTIVPTTGFLILKSGYLFAAAEFGNHQFYQIVQLGEESSSLSIVNDIPVYDPRGLVNLQLVDVMESVNPIIDAQVHNLTGEESPQIYALSGLGHESTFQILRHGLEVTEMAVSDLPGYPNGIWSLKKSLQDPYECFIVVSFATATVVLSIGEIVEEVTDTKFLLTSPSLLLSQMADNSYIQVYTTGVRHIKEDGSVSEWNAPEGQFISKATCNLRQVLISIGAELVYFILSDHGDLAEAAEHKEMSSDVISLALPSIEEGRVRSKFAAVGCVDMTVRILSLNPNDCLEALSLQALNSRPESLLILSSSEMGSGANESVLTSILYLHVGQDNGLTIRNVIDPITGELSNARPRFLGPHPVHHIPIQINQKTSLLSLCSRPWLSYVYHERSHVIPLFYDALNFAATFSSEVCLNGLVAISGNTLRILALERLGGVFASQKVPLRGTGKKMIFHSFSRTFVVLQSDYQPIMYDAAEHEPKKSEVQEKNLEEEEDMEMDEGDAPKDTSNDANQSSWLIHGKKSTSLTSWNSFVQVIHPFSAKVIYTLALPSNEVAFCLTFAVFHGQPESQYFILGTATDVQIHPSSGQQFSEAFLSVYKLVDGNEPFQFVHKTQVEEIPMACAAYKGRLLVGLGRTLRLFDLGKKKLLRKCEHKGFPRSIVSIETMGNRIYVADIQDSVHFVLFKAEENAFYIFADDMIPRWTSSIRTLDYDSVAGGDKFGHFFVLRLSKNLSDEIENDTTGFRLLDKGHLLGAPHKLESVAEYYVGDTITSLNRATLVFGGREILLYTTISGSIGVMMPFSSREDVNFFQRLEMHMRQEAAPLCGRDHLMYRSYYCPVKGVIDGTLCELYAALPYEKRRTIAEDLDRTAFEVTKKIEDMRFSVAF